MRALYEAPPVGTVGGIFEKMLFSESEEKLVVKREADVEPVLEQNKRMLRDAETGNGGYSPTRELRRVAQIPNILIEKWMIEEGLDVFKREHWPRVAKKLDDPAYAHLRTAPGRVSKRPYREYLGKPARLGTPKPLILGADGRALR